MLDRVKSLYVILQSGPQPLTASHFLWIMTGLAIALSLCSFSLAGEILVDSAAGGRQEMTKIRSETYIQLRERTNAIGELCGKLPIGRIVEDTFEMYLKYYRYMRAVSSASFRYLDKDTTNKIWLKMYLRDR